VDEEALVKKLNEALAGSRCKYCGVTDQIRIEFRLVAKPLGTWSLSGAQLKTSAYRWPWAICDNCGHESKGKVGTGENPDE